MIRFVLVIYLFSEDYPSLFHHMLGDGVYMSASDTKYHKMGR